MVRLSSSRVTTGGERRGRAADRPPRRVLAGSSQDVAAGLRRPAGQVEELGRQGRARRTPAGQVLRGVRDRRRAAARRPAAAGQGPGAPAGHASTASTRSRSRRSGPRSSATTRSARSSTPRRSPPPLTEMRKAVSHAWLTLPAREVRRARPDPAQAAARRAGRRHRATPDTDQAPRRRAPARAGLPDRVVDAAQARRARAVLARRRPVDRGLPARRRSAARRHGDLPGGVALLALGRARPGARGQRQHRQPARARTDGNDTTPGAAVGLRHAAAAGRDGGRADRRHRDRT